MARTRRRGWPRSLIGAFALLLAAPGAAVAAGPLLVNGAGTPLVWSAQPIPYNPDLGPLGQLDNTQAVALVETNFGVWEAVAASSASFTNAGPLPVDVTAANFGAYVGTCGDGFSPIIFDHDGSITDAFFGAGASRSVLGFAGPECGTVATGEIHEGLAVLNGKFIDGVGNAQNPEITLNDFNAVFIHEFGHYVNLDHSQVNLDEAFDGNAANDDAVATMFPFLINGTEAGTLHLDDEVSISTLYPGPEFNAGFGAITGSVFLSDGLSLFQGAYVIARNTADPRLSAVGVASGARYFPFQPGGPPPPSLLGLFEIRGLPEAEYTVEIESIHPGFTDGSSVGPLDPPVPLPGPPEFWNGADESAVDPPDDPSLSVPLNVTAGTVQSDVNVIVNGASGDTYAGFKSKASKIGKTNFLPAAWDVTLDAVVLPNTDVDEPENYRIKREKHLLNAAAVNAAVSPERPEVHYIRYRAVRSPQGAGGALAGGGFPRTVKHVPRRWELVNQFGSLVVQSKKVVALLVPATTDANTPPFPPADETHFLCYRVRVIRGAPSDQVPSGRFRKDVQTFLADSAFDDCALNEEGSPNFVGTAVEGKCLYDVIKPVELCVPVTVGAVEPPRQTSAVIDGSSPTVQDPLTCYRARLASKVKGAGVATVLDAAVGDPLEVRQARHVKRRLRDSTQVFAAPGNGFPAPTQLDTVKANLVCVPTLVQEVSGF